MYTENNEKVTNIYEGFFDGISYCGDPIYKYILNVLHNISRNPEIKEMLDQRKKYDENNHEGLSQIPLDIFKKKIKT